MFRLKSDLSGCKESKTIVLPVFKMSSDFVSLHFSLLIKRPGFLYPAAFFVHQIIDQHTCIKMVSPPLPFLNRRFQRRLPPVVVMESAPVKSGPVPCQPTVSGSPPRVPTQLHTTTDQTPGR